MRFGNIDDWASDRTRELEGVPCAIGRGREIIVRRAGTRNRAYIAGLATLNGAEDIAAIERLFAETVVIGWRGLTDEAGAEVPFSAEACVDLFRAAPDLADHVARFAADRGNYAAQELEAEGESLRNFPGGN